MRIIRTGGQYKPRDQSGQRPSPQEQKRPDQMTRYSKHFPHPARSGESSLSLFAAKARATFSTTPHSVFRRYHGRPHINGKTSKELLLTSRKDFIWLLQAPSAVLATLPAYWAGSAAATGASGAAWPRGPITASTARCATALPVPKAIPARETIRSNHRCSAVSQRFRRGTFTVEC
jgi:hypothetical protein